MVLLTGKAQKEKKKEKEIGVSGFVHPFSYPSINVYKHSHKNAVGSSSGWVWRHYNGFPLEEKTVSNK